jgi:hypothetical protein
LLNLYPLFPGYGGLHQNLWLQKHGQIGLAVSGHDTHPDLLLLDNGPQENQFNQQILLWMLVLK